jgi:hypothetical protein
VLTFQEGKAKGIIDNIRGETMTKLTQNKPSNLSSLVHILIGVLVFGSIWGFFEMTLGGFLHAIHFPQKGAVMGGLAISLMAVFLSITRRPSLVPLLGIIAASFKPFDALIFGVPMWSPYIVNPAIAIVMEATAFGVVAILLKRAMDKHFLYRATAGLLAGGFGYISYAILASTLGLGIWPTLGLVGKIQLIITNMIPIAMAGALTLVAGYCVGKVSAPRIFTIQKFHPQLYYSSSLALVLLCWIIPVIYHPGG